jgi:hypothetical protein
MEKFVSCQRVMRIGPGHGHPDLQAVQELGTLGALIVDVQGFTDEGWAAIRNCSCFARSTA